METPKDIEVYNTKTQNHRLYQFITAIDDKYESVKKEILKIEPLPSVEQAYAIVRRKDARSHILQPTAHGEDRNTIQGVDAELAVRDRARSSQPSSHRNGGSGGNWGQRPPKEDRSKMVCSHCGRKKHTREMYFELVGFPKWWEARNDRPPPNAVNKGGRTAVVVGGNGGTPATGGGNTEAATTRGNNRDHRPVEEVPLIACAKLATGVKEAASSQGILGFEGLLPLNPPTLPYYQKLPHVFHKRPPVSDKLHQEPHYQNIYENSPISCKNHFEILRNVSTACTAATSSDKTIGEYLTVELQTR